jgi:hypothetical protein
MPVLIVPHGYDSEYYAFLEMTAHANGDGFIIDRRRLERRTTMDTRQDNRRSADRRGPPPVSWDRDGLIVIRDDAPRRNPA